MRTSRLYALSFSAQLVKVLLNYARLSTLAVAHLSEQLGCRID